MSRIFRALQQLERAYDEKASPSLGGTEESSSVESPVTIPYPGIKREGGPASDADRVWRSDGPHRGKLSPAGPFLDRAAIHQQKADAGNPLAAHLRTVHGLYQEHVKDIVQAVILKAAWKYQDHGCVTTHLVDVTLDLGLTAALATGLAEKTSGPILLVDADLWAARLTRRLGGFGPRGFHEVLRGGSTLEAELPTSWMNLRFLTGKPLAAPLPAWVECTRLFDDFRARYLVTLAIYPLQTDEFLPRLLRASDEVWLWCSAQQTSRRALRAIVDHTKGLSCELSGAVLISAS